MEEMGTVKIILIFIDNQKICYCHRREIVQ